MRAFSGIVDLPALFIVVAALIIIALSNGFAVKKTALSARALLMEVALLMLLINFVPLFDDPLNFMTLPYVLSFSLVIFVWWGSSLFRCMPRCRKTPCPPHPPQHPCSFG